MAERAESFLPVLPTDHWKAIEPFVRGAVADCAGRTPYSVRQLLTVTSSFTHWCWQSAGLPLERSVVFYRDVIARYAAVGCDRLTPASRGNVRSRLLRMSEILLPPDKRVSRLAPLPPATAAQPYSRSEITALRGWASGQNTTLRTEVAHVLLTLGLGCGLAAQEIAGVRIGDVTVDDQGVLVRVTGKRARTVPVLAEWEPVLANLKDTTAPVDKFLLIPNRVATSKNLITGFVNKSAGTQLRPQTQRMRATWVVAHLTAGTPVRALLEAAGVDSLEAFTRFVPFIPLIDAAQARRALRLGAH